MSWRAWHLGIGVAGTVAFLATGADRLARLPDLDGANEALRYLYRSNHTYLLLASLVNLALGVQPAAMPAGWRAVAGKIGSVLALASPVVLCFALVYEAAQASPVRIMTDLAVYALAAGVVAHVVGATGRR